MQIRNAIPQLRTTDFPDSIRFYTTILGGTLDFCYEDHYAGIRLGAQEIHLKRVEEPDPSIPFVRDGGHLHLYLQTDDVDADAESLRRKGVRLVCEPHETPWKTREFIINDNQGHTLYFGQPL